MSTLFVDLETRSSRSTRDGLAAYAEHATILLVSWAVDDGPVRVEETVSPAFLQALARADLVVAHNAPFDLSVLEAATGMRLPAERVRCTMAAALRAQLPGSLEQLGEALGLSQDEAKLSDAAALVKRFCIPSPSRKGAAYTEPSDAPEDWERFKAYAERDVIALRHVYRRLQRFDARTTAHERVVEALDMTINRRGIPIDRALVEAASRVAEQLKQRLKQEVADVSEGLITSPAQVVAIQRVLAGHGYRLPTLSAPVVETFIEQNDGAVEPWVIELLRLRLAGSKSSASKYARLLSALSEDNRLRWCLKYYGAARTGRWSGKVFQPQNLPRVVLPAKELQEARELVLRGQLLDAYPLTPGDDGRPTVGEVLAQLLRSAVRASEGHVLVGADLSNIEGRLLAYIACERWKVEAFERFDAGSGPDLYKLAYAASFGIPVEDVSKEQRQIGKVQELALGYGGGQGAFESMAALFGISLPPMQVADTVQRWRSANASIARMWRRCEEAIAAPSGTPTTIGRGVTAVVGDDRCLQVQLPSGRIIRYHGLKRDLDTETMRREATYVEAVGWVPQTRKLYGGKLTAGIVQATARDVLTAGLRRAEAAGFPVVLTVHDEIVAEVPIERWRAGLNAAKLVELMTQPLLALPGLPLAASGWEGDIWAKG